MKVVRGQSALEVSERQRRMLIDDVQRHVFDRFGLTGYDPVVHMALVACDPQVTDVSLKLRAHAEVAKYWHPQLKQVELTGAGGGPVLVRQELVAQVLALVGLVKDGEEGPGVGNGKTINGNGKAG